MSVQQFEQAIGSHREGRVIYDADSHITEMPGWLESYCSDYVKANLLPGLIPLDMPALQPVLGQANNRLEGKDPELTEKMKADLFGAPEKRNLFAAFGATEKKERSESLDLVGISSQLVFPTIALARFTRTPDLDVIYGGAEALNRGMADFCSDDPRLLAVGHVPLNDPKRAIASLKLALDLGVRTIWLRSDAMDGRAPSHRDYDPLWAMMEEAGVPISLHIGSGERMPEEYMNTGVTRNLEPSLTNIESTKPHDIPVLHHSPERWLTCMIYHGVLDRFPKLKIGMIELGANWVPTMMQNLDIGKFELGKFDKDLQALALKPSEYVTRQVRVTPLHMENTGWILRNVGKEILMFNTDYPHPEGGSDPFGDFERSLNAVNATEEELDHFYTKNYQDFLGL
jgi:predicted TIM-barrel fold metal-dependent hydrolase